jgi:glycosyltransferase involved in cell wall biosynthesis
MKFSLILSTKDRTTEIIKLFEGFKSQTLQDFEIIVSDQNDDDRVADLLKTINWPGKLTYIKTTNGLSAGRNAGLDLAQGEIVTFPDDDCMYFPTLLEDVARFFDTHPEFGYLSGRSVAEDGGDGASTHGKVAGVIQPLSIYLQCIEFAFFIRRESLGTCRFDEKMGVGAKSRWQADEGPDLMLTLREKGINGYYDPVFAIYHPRFKPTFGEAMVARCYKYSCGSGYFLRKHNYPFWYLLKVNAKTFCGLILSALALKPSKVRFYWARICGRWDGWKGYAEEHGSPASRALSRNGQ